MITRKSTISMSEYGTDYKETRGWVIINPADGSFIDVVNTADIYSRR